MFANANSCEEPVQVYQEPEQIFEEEPLDDYFAPEAPALGFAFLPFLATIAKRAILAKAQAKAQAQAQAKAQAQAQAKAQAQVVRTPTQTPWATYALIGGGVLLTGLILIPLLSGKKG